MTEEQTLLTDAENYRHTLQAYLQNMKQLEPQRQWMKEKLGPRLGEIFGRKKELRALAIGTGSGEVDIDFLNEIVKQAENLHGEDYSVVYQVVEPNASSIEYFRGVVSKIESYRKVKFQWFQGFFEDFLNDFSQHENEGQQFDFVHFVRCFYHIDSVTGLNATYNRFLTKNGIVAVVGENEDAFWPKQMLFLNNHSMTHECFTCSGPVSKAYFLPGWISQAIENNWKYETHIEKYNFDVTSVYDENSAVGNFLLDFAMHRRNSRKTLKKEILDDFFKLLEENVKEEEIEEDGKKMLKKHFPCELGAIIITKE